MATGMELDIEPLVPRKRTRALLIDSALRIPEISGPNPDDNRAVGNDGVSEAPDGGYTGAPVNRWAAGITFTPYGCVGLQRIPDAFCIPEGDDPENEIDWDTDLTIFESFQVFGDDRCSALSTDFGWLQARLDARWAALASEQLALELMQAANSGSSPSLGSSATIVTGAPADTELLLPLCENYLAQVLHGAQGMIHLTPGALTLADVFHRLKLEDDGTYTTPTGHIVVADAGYLGLDPDGGVPEDGTEYAYVSSMVGLEMGPPDDLGNSDQGLDRSRNIWHARKIAQAIFMFDPCSVGAIQFELPGFSGS